MSRPSLEARQIIPLPVADRVDPPDNLTAKERVLFREIVMRCPPQQFGLADVFLLTSFTRVTLLAERASHELTKARTASERNSWMKMLDQSTKLQAQLATKLRLATSSRTDATKLSRKHAAHRLSYYDTMDQEDG